MEDAHLAFIKDDWAFFGVFDGHGGDACSGFVASRLNEELTSNGCPKENSDVKELIFKIDQEFLDSQQPSGSTGTMCIVHKPEKLGDKHRLRVINVGDSRVILGRRNGEIVDGGGTDQGLTTDHKPDHEVERERIYRTGGTVECRGGNCARVNGDLAVSRAFGDREYKKTGGPGLEDRPVTSDPEFGTFECSETDFLLLVCDGVSEGDFSNPDVVKFVAGHLDEGKDAGEVAKAVCHEAVAKNSKDNISCMIVLFDGDKDSHSKEFNPSSIQEMQHKGFKSAYEAMARRGDLTLAQAVEQRHELLCAADTLTNDEQEELDMIAEPGGEKGSKARSQWFQQWLEDLPEKEDKMGMLLGMLGARGKGKGKGQTPDSHPERNDAASTIQRAFRRGGGKGGTSAYPAPPRPPVVHQTATPNWEDPPEPLGAEETRETPKKEDSMGYTIV